MATIAERLSSFATSLRFQDLPPEVVHQAKRLIIDTLGCAFGGYAGRPSKLARDLASTLTSTQPATVLGSGQTTSPDMAAFANGVMIRYLDFNDTWLAAEWGHPSDNLGGILAVADYLSRQNRATGKAPLTMGDVLTAMIKAHEIQGCLALENSFNRVGLDHVLLVRVASTAVVAQLLGADHSQIVDALSHAWVDGSSLRTYRHAPNTGSRKSWAAGDATSRAVRLALIAMTGEMGYPSALTAKTWGYYDVLFKGKPFEFTQGYASYVMENILFKISFPAEFHAQTAVEAGMTLHEQVKDRLDDIERVVIETQEPGVRIIDKTGPLDNPADRDHCIQYMIAVPMIFGRLTAADYEDDVASDPRIDVLRDKMEVRENEGYTRDYFDAEKRYIGNAVQVFFKDGSSIDNVEVHFPIGHRKRRDEGIPVLVKKFEASLSGKLKEGQWNKLNALCADHAQLVATPVDDFMALLVV